MDELVGSLIGALCGLGILGFLIAYTLLMPEKAAIVAGWLWTGIAQVWRKADKRAVALSVQGAVNDGQSRAFRSAPTDLVEGRLRLEWADIDQPTAAVEGSDVVVFMRESKARSDNIAHALMAYLPKAVIPRARRYVDPATMRAADLTLAKSILADRDMEAGALDAFYEKHLDPERREDADLSERLSAVDHIDLHGWLTRILLPEYRELGNRLHPGECDEQCLADADAFMRWLEDLSNHDGTRKSLDYEGPHFRISVIFVAIWGKLAAEGLSPYRKRAKRLLYQDKVDVVYLLARDRSIPAVKELAESLRGDGIIASVAEHEYRLRPDFRARILNRERAICVALRRRDVQLVGAEPEGDTDERSLPHEVTSFRGQTDGDQTTS